MSEIPYSPVGKYDPTSRTLEFCVPTEDDPRGISRKGERQAVVAPILYEAEHVNLCFSWYPLSYGDMDEALYELHTEIERMTSLHAETKGCSKALAEAVHQAGMRGLAERGFKAMQATRGRR